MTQSLPIVQQCPACGTHLYRCDKCGIALPINDLHALTRTVPPPFGSFNAHRPKRVCLPCWEVLVGLTWEWFGETYPGKTFPGEERI